jgi:hypothetical protein
LKHLCFIIFGAQVDFKQGTDQPPLAITICNKGLEMNYTFPELQAVDVRQQPNSQWQSIWPDVKHGSESVVEKKFVSITHKERLRFCKTINLPKEAQFAVRMRHFYSRACDLKAMEVYLHSPGQFHSADFTILMPKKMLSNDQNFILQLNIEIINSLTSEDYSCSEENGSETLDSCILEEAFRQCWGSGSGRIRIRKF